MGHTDNSGRQNESDVKRVEAYLRGTPECVREIDAWIRGGIGGRYPALRHEMDDLSQAVHQRLLINLRAARFQHRSSLRGYVSGIVHHACIDRLRKRYRDVIVPLDENHPIPDDDNPYRAIVAQDERRLAHQALSLSPSSCRELWSMIFLEKLSYEEIGTKLSIPPGTVKSRVWHCRKKAKKILERLVGHQPRRPGTDNRRFDPTRIEPAPKPDDQAS